MSLRSILVPPIPFRASPLTKQNRKANPKYTPTAEVIKWGRLTSVCFQMAEPNTERGEEVLFSQLSDFLSHLQCADAGCQSLSHLQYWGTSWSHIRMCSAKCESSLHTSCLCGKRGVSKLWAPQDWGQLIKHPVCPCFTAGRIGRIFKEFSGDLPQRWTSARLDSKANWPPSSEKLPQGGLPQFPMLCDIWAGQPSPPASVPLWLCCIKQAAEVLDLVHSRTGSLRTWVPAASVRCQGKVEKWGPSPGRCFTILLSAVCSIVPFLSQKRDTVNNVLFGNRTTSNVTLI